MGNSMELVLKACKDCGQEEMMVPSCDRCSACREKRMAYNNAKYRERHREEIRRRSINRYYEKTNSTAVSQADSHMHVPSDFRLRKAVRQIQYAHRRTE